MTRVYWAQGETGQQAAQLARSAAFAAVGVPADAQEKRTVLGKPYLPDRPGIHYNISHSGTYGVCALSDAPVGVDVELVRPLRRAVAQRFFTDVEQEFLAQRPPEEFFRLWTRKESFTKALGKGLSLPLNSFSVLEDVLYRDTIAWYFHEYPIDGGWLTVCCQQTQAEFLRVSL
jgi:4'-phosphopantetheinyl transferase